MIFNNDDDAEAAAASVVTLVSHLTWSRYFGQHDCQASTPEKQNAVENVSNQINQFNLDSNNKKMNSIKSLEQKYKISEASISQ